MSESDVGVVQTLDVEGTPCDSAEPPEPAETLEYAAPQVPVETTEVTEAPGPTEPTEPALEEPVEEAVPGSPPKPSEDTEHVLEALASLQVSAPALAPNSLLVDPMVQRWLFENSFDGPNKKAREAKENQWGRQLLQKGTDQWTTEIGERIARELLEAQERERLSLTSRDPPTALVWRPKPVKLPTNARDTLLKPDWETQGAIWEVKTRKWNTSGTAGEKVLGVPYKYADVPSLYDKPLYIVCVAFQEKDSVGKSLFQPTDNQQALLDVYTSNNIHFVRASELYSKYIDGKYRTHS